MRGVSRVPPHVVEVAFDETRTLTVVAFPSGIGRGTSPQGTPWARHPAVEAGLGTLGLNLQLLTPQYGLRVILMAVLSSAPVAADRGRSVLALPADAACACLGDVIGH
jgi:hypothetical protein